MTQATEELEELAQMFADRPVALLTGAGISTDSGIPDYRGTGAPVRAPMSVQQFLADHHYRQRFWGGARVGALRTRNIAPNEGHRATARMETAGLLSGVITQNMMAFTPSQEAAISPNCTGTGGSFAALSTIIAGICPRSSSGSTLQTPGLPTATPMPRSPPTATPT